MKPLMTEDTSHLIESLNRLVQTEVVRRTSSNSTYEEKYDMLVFDLTRLIEDAQLLVEDYRSQELTFNTIEAEGYRRAMLTVKEIIDEYKN